MGPQKRGQEPIAKWPEGCCALLVPDPFSEIFEEALSLASHADREEFLSKACDGRPELLISVKSLLAAYSDGEILERTLLPVAVTQSLHTADMSGIKIGPYLLRQLIGHGGMGAVYLAEQQQPIQRKVALKIVRPERSSHDALRRFQVEQQSLARLEHPHIAQVLDASVTNSGISYFAMELVDGLPILACCEKHSLSIPDRLRLMVQCCQAIQHAHQRSIIHRDIKPSNVLVTLHEGSWFVKVIDFGIAKAFSETESDDLNSTSNTATQFGVFLGTPLYMSPEQASMGSVAIDPRADIYSLGALFYSVLTGLPPYDPGRFRNLRLDEVRLIISDEDPVLPSARVRHKISSSDSTSTDVSENRRLALQLSGDLDCVVMKAMQKDRDQRYQTVGRTY
jgi:serine/threonine protein kinase